MDIITSARLLNNKVGDNTRKYGICATCTHAVFQVFSQGGETAHCYFNHTRPTKIYSSDPIIDCSLFYDKLAPTLIEMQRIATTIEIKRKAGFVEDAEVIITKPEDRKANYIQYIDDEGDIL